VTIIGAAVPLLVTTLMACLVPAARAVRVNPSEAFRSE
jgi:ABC-type lipoprotein release transport system permease subunit